MFKHLDWKYFLTLFMSAVAIAVTVWIWQADKIGKSLTVTVLSQASLQPSPTSSIPGIELSIEGISIKDPFLSVLSIENEGGKAISSKDYETPLEITVASPVNVIRSRIISKSPDDIQVSINTDQQIIRMQPTLLNEKDSITLSVLTSGGEPKFFAKARIIGLKSVQFHNSNRQKPSKSSIALNALTTVLFSAIALVALAKQEPIWTNNEVLFRNRTVYVIYFMCMSLALASYITLSKSLEFESMLSIIIGGVFMLIFSGGVAWLLERSSKNENKLQVDDPKKISIPSLDVNQEN